jgi:hypothetical protein
MKKTLYFGMITPIALMLLMLSAEYCKPQSGSSGGATSAQTPAPSDPAEAKKKELYLTVIDETKDLDVRREASDKLYALDKTYPDAIPARNRVYEKVKEREAQKSTKQKEENEQKQKEEQLKTACAMGATSLLRGDLPRAQEQLNLARSLNPQDARVRDLESRIRALQSQMTTRNWGLGIFIGAFVLGSVALIVRAVRSKKMALRVMDGPDAGYPFLIEHPRVRVGSSPDHSEIVIVDDEHRISRVHFELYRSGNRYYIRDLSSNCTKVNDEPLARGETATVKAGDVITLADAASLEFIVAGKDVIQQANEGGA